MPQLSSNFTLRSKAANFDRDSFSTWQLMATVESSWMDEGHISYCKEKGKHYVFRSVDENNVILTGEDRWTPLISEGAITNEIVNYVNNNTTYVVDGLSSLNDVLAQELPAGKIVYVKENQSVYYNVYDNTRGATPQEGEYLRDTTGYFHPVKSDLDQYAKKSDLDQYVSKSELPEIEGGVTQKDLEDYVKKSDLEPINNILNTNSNAIGSVGSKVAKLESDAVTKSDLETEKSNIDKKYASKEFALGIQEAITQKINSEFVSKADLEEYKETVVTTDVFDTHLADFNDHKSDFEEYKEFVDETYAKPKDISGLLNNYHPNVEFTNKWIGTDVAGDLAGMTGNEVSNATYSYSAVLDKMLFGDYTPSVSKPSVTMKLKEDWEGNQTIEWYDKKSRSIMVEAGSTGPDGSDFIADVVTDSFITYPEKITLDPHHTNGLVPSTDEQQTSIGFCKVKNADGEWDYYRKDGNRYHVPAVLEEGEYRYYYVGFFKAGSPAINNENETVFEWAESTPVESEDYITFYASKPVYYNTPDGMVKKPLKLWNADSMEDEFTLIPSCQLEQSFMVPRKLKALYIWNDLLGGYGQVPMVKELDDEGVETENIVPAYFKEEIEENGYYTYRYNSASNGHRGAVKIKVVF